VELSNNQAEPTCWAALSLISALSGDPRTVWPLGDVTSYTFTTNSNEPTWYLWVLNHDP